jgi:hypothetical protein
MGARTGKLTEITQRLKKFITHDIRKNRILGLYLVIGVMVLGYAIYFMVVMYKDITSGPEKRSAVKPKVEQVRKARAPRKKPPVKKKATAPAPKQEAPKQEAPKQVKLTKKVAKKPKPVGGKKLNASKWKSLEFPDGSHISFPTDWSQSEVNSDKHILHGIRLQAPDSKASFKCYTRSRKIGDNYALIASKQEFAKLQPYYGAIVDSYGDAGVSSTSAVSIEQLEQDLEKSIEDEKEYLVGSTVYIKMQNGALHKGVVIAEDDSSITLESFRFGGRYSFTVKRNDIVEIIR